MDPAQTDKQTNSLSDSQAVPQPFFRPKQQLNPAPLSGSDPSAKTLADILLEQGVLTPDKAKQVKLAEIQTGKPQEDILTSQKLASESALTRAKAQLFNIPYIDLTSIPVSTETISLLPQEIAKRFRCFPVSKDDASKQMVLAMADPLDLTAIEFVEQKTGYLVKPQAADPSKIDILVSTSYATSLAKEVSEALREVGTEDMVKTLDATRTGLIREEKVAEIVTHILSFAMKARASDVHIEPQEKNTRVRYRIDGILQEKLTIPRELHDALISRIKILSGMKIDEKRIPQDGRFNFKSEEEEVDLRVSTLPVTWGEKVVMRLLKKTGGIPTLDELGLRGRALKNLEDAILRPHGIILITGPTGSGKTTTLYSIMQKINTPKVHIVTLEDPIEYKIAGINQVQINPGAGLTFASGLRSFLRQDPNIILVGEIRDQETADLAVQAALTGHLVFSTLHTNNASGALPRLLDMRAEPYLLASSITAIVAQRVVRKIHEDCKTEYVPEPKVIEEMKMTLGTLWPKDKRNVQLFRGKGDPDCGNTGYIGRIGIFEVLPVSEKISRLILEHASSADIEKVAVSEGMIAMKQDGYMKVLEGITTVEEVLRVAQE
jgi:type IV pilus assembly protein PilB